MSAAPTVVLYGPRAVSLAQGLVRQAPAGSVVTIKPPRRTLDQNSKLHAMLTDIARQVDWAGAKRDVEAWKDIFTAGLKSAQHGLDVVPGLNGGFVLLGMHTSSMSVGEMADLITFVQEWGDRHEIRWSDLEGRAAEAAAAAA